MITPSRLWWVLLALAAVVFLTTVVGLVRYTRPVGG